MHAGFSPRTRWFVRVAGRLVLFALVVQLLAFDHWDVNAVVGVEDSQAHVMHCHGDAAGCADVSGMLGALTDAGSTPASPLAVLYELIADRAVVLEAFVSTQTPPPRIS